MTNCECEFEAKSNAERRTLLIVLSINGVMFVSEFAAGILANSTGLTADSLDMFADASVYAISYYAVGRSQAIRNRAATGSGIFQIVLGLSVLLDVGRRFFFGGEPISVAMMAMGLLALAANATCLSLLAKHRHGDVNLRASWIFSTNDIIANLGVIVSGGLVWLTASRFPDLLIGFIIAFLVVRGGSKILAEAKAQRLKPNA